MSSVTNTDLSSLTQYLSGTSSPLLAAGLSASQIKKVVADATPEDVVKLSDEAMQLQNVGDLFGSSQTSTSQQSGISNVFDAMAQAQQNSQNSQSGTLTELNQSQTANIQALFGTTNSSSDTTGTSLNVVL